MSENNTKIIVDIIDGKKYITSTYRGTVYCLSDCLGDWYVSTRRLALGRGNLGSGKYHNTLQDVVDNCKAFGTIENVIKLMYNLNLTDNNN